MVNSETASASNLNNQVNSSPKVQKRPVKEGIPAIRISTRQSANLEIAVNTGPIPPLPLKSDQVTPSPVSVYSAPESGQLSLSSCDTDHIQMVDVGHFFSLERNTNTENQSK